MLTFPENKYSEFLGMEQGKRGKYWQLTNNRHKNLSNVTFPDALTIPHVLPLRSLPQTYIKTPLMKKVSDGLCRCSLVLIRMKIFPNQSVTTIVEIQ